MSEPQIIRHEDGTTSVTITLSASASAALDHMELWRVADQVWSALLVTAAIRRHHTGSATDEHTQEVMAELLMDCQRLAERVASVRDVAAATYMATGGTATGLAAAMDRARTTAYECAKRGARGAGRYDQWVRTGATTTSGELF